jgi:hypothetical protein
MATFLLLTAKNVGFRHTVEVVDSNIGVCDRKFAVSNRKNSPINRNVRIPERQRRGRG